MKCECTDPGCGECVGRCQRKGKLTVFRIDMDDYTGTLVCSACAEDAMDSGVFAFEPADGNED